MDDSRKRAELHPVKGARDAGRLSDELVAFHAPLTAATEAYRMVRTNLFYALVDQPPEVVVIASPGPGEGKSVTCANLGITLAQAGKNVLIVDCDLRDPDQHRLFGMSSSPGLVDVLAGARNLQRSWETPLDGLHVIPGGHIPINPSEMLGSRRFVEFLAKVRQEYDYVLLDTPPVCAVSDSAIVARHGDGVLLILDFEKTNRRPMRRAMGVLEGVGARVIGTVVNKAHVSKSDQPYGYVG
jgi:capsular exopolysaccharide synthesis family protein